MSEYFWKAKYNDGTELAQLTSERESKYSDIDRSKLIGFELWNKDVPALMPALRINLESGQRLIYRRRVQIHMTSSGRIDEVFHIIGWQQTIQGQNVQSILLFQDGIIEMIGKWNDKNILHCSPILRDDEKEPDKVN